MQKSRLENSTLAAMAEKLLANDSILSSSSSSSNETSKVIIIPPKDEKKVSISFDDQIKPKKSTLKINETKKSNQKGAEISKKAKKSRSRSKSKSKIITNISSLNQTIESLQNLKDKYKKSKDTLDSQQKQLKKLYKKVSKDNQNHKNLTFYLENTESITKNAIVKDLQEKLKESQTNEFALIKELHEQQKISKEALNKLYELQEESLNEIDKAKNYYKDYYHKYDQEEKRAMNDRIRLLENELNILENEKKELNSIKTDGENQYNELFAQVKKLENGLKMSNLENDKLKANLNNLKEEYEKLKLENDKLYKENEKLKKEFDILKQEIISDDEYEKTQKKRCADIQLKFNENIFTPKGNREIDNNYIEEINTLKSKIDKLNLENNEMDRIIRTKDKTYKDQLELINNKLNTLQVDLKKIPAYEAKIEELSKEIIHQENEILKIKAYYQGKLNKKKFYEEGQKTEWSNIYNELVNEIKQLKIQYGNQ